MSGGGSRFPWLPAGFSVGGNFAVRRVIDQGPADGSPAYQLLDSQDGENFCLLIKPENCPLAAKSAITALDIVRFEPVCWGKSNFPAAVFERKQKPFRLADVFSRATLLQNAEAKELARALAAISASSWLESLYLPPARAFLPLGKAESAQERRLLAAKMLTGDIADSPMSPKQIHAINKWITPGEIGALFGVLKMPQPDGARKRPMRAPSDFVLPGQPELEEFFREDVIEYHRNLAKYRAMGANPPGGVLLYGKPGSGKTYAVRQLADFLAWPMIEIGIGQIGSPYIHQTSKELNRQFEQAIKQAPSIVFMDEIDALGGNRGASSQDHKTEEISELLKLVEKAVKSGVFVVAATNRPEAVDPALKRTGRFDHHLEVKHPDADAMLAILQNCLSLRPHRAEMNLRPFAEILTKKPASEAEFIVNKAAKIAARSGRDEIDEECLWQAAQQRFPGNDG